MGLRRSVKGSMDHPVQESRVRRIFCQTDLKYTFRGAESRDINLKK